MRSKYVQYLENRIKELEEENQELRENDWAWHQLLKTQNEREYRSKFLKDFQKKYGKHVYPDYDEIYKRYDNMLNKLKDIDSNAQYIIDYGFDYDGFNTVKSLKGLIDMLVDYARDIKAIISKED